MICKNCNNHIQDGSIFCSWCGEKQIKTEEDRKQISVPTPRRLKSGTWFIQLMVNGERISISDESEELCRAKAIAYKAGIGKAKKKPAGITLGAAIDEYIASKDKILSPSTVRGYKAYRRTRLQSIMNVPISGVENWQKVFNEESAKCSAKYLKNLYSLVRASCAPHGVNVSIKVPQIVRKERPWLDPEQIKVFVAGIAGKPYEIAALLALHGLRRSELLALTWDNIDIDGEKIHVAGAAVYDENHNLVRKETTKNVSSRRTVPFMIPSLKPALIAHKAESVTVVDSNNHLWRNINACCEKLNLPPVGVHGLRHSFCSLCYHLGIPEQEVMTLGGWSDYNTIHKIYLHLSHNDLTAAADKIKAHFAV